jgi:hypothetical protein
MLSLKLMPFGDGLKILEIVNLFKNYLDLLLIPLKKLKTSNITKKLLVTTS